MKRFYLLATIWESWALKAECAGPRGMPGSLEKGGLHRWQSVRRKEQLGGFFKDSFAFWSSLLLCDQQENSSGISIDCLCVEPSSQQQRAACLGFISLGSLQTTFPCLPRWSRGDAPPFALCDTSGSRHQPSHRRLHFTLSAQ